MLRLAELALSHCASRLVPTVGSAASETHFRLRSLPLGEVTAGDYGNSPRFHSLTLTAVHAIAPAIHGLTGYLNPLYSFLLLR